jgi:hypothetical protein
MVYTLVDHLLIKFGRADALSGNFRAKTGVRSPYLPHLLVVDFSLAPRQQFVYRLL